jgi:uncharacterized alkaline shock family protein YloU
MTEAHTIESPAGTITVVPAVLAQVVRRAAESVEGVRLRRPRRGLEIDVEESGARVSLELVVRYGLVLPVAAGTVQERVAEALETMCGLDATPVDVSVEELDVP